MKPYFSTFPAGAESIVERALKKQSPDIEVRNTYSGLVIYDSKYSVSNIRQIRFFQNSFALLYEMGGIFSLKEIFNKLRTDEEFIERLKKALPRKAKFFKLVASVENQTMVMPHIQLGKLESRIIRETKLVLSTKSPDAEIWIVQRREGFVLVGLRITYPDPRVPKPERGELSSQMSNILCLASGPSSRDTVLDPFAGYGGIIFEIANTFPYKKIIAVENNELLIRRMRMLSRKMNKAIDIKHGYAQSLNLPDESVDVIITDPPWGMYSNGLDITGLYSKVLNECERVLVGKGRMTVLTGAKHEFEEALEKSSSLTLKDKTDVLVSGKKAAIYQVFKS